MAFTKLSIGAAGADAAPGTIPAAETDIWTIFRALRDARSVLGLRPGHIQTLQAMLSFLKPGHGETVFASNNSICQRVGGIDERTLRRHINRFVELGFIKRNDSSNRKRYRVRSSGGECISYGLSLAPLLQRASELLAIAQKMENNRRDRIFVRKQILTKLAHLEEHDPSNTFINHARKALRRKLSLPEYHALLADTDTECQGLYTPDDPLETMKLPANDGQTVRHQSKSEEEKKDLDSNISNEALKPDLLTSVCDQATSFSTERLRNWLDIENHARTLAPMMGIHPETFEKAMGAVGAQKASCAIFIMLQLGKRIRDFGAYFHSITLGQRQNQFDPLALITRLSETNEPTV
ncbi:replication initiator RepC (plasmid) [Pacificitalea manganoxidans]|uniref:Replication initiator RepC n=1 Tax=Pacificitalea manganoxidans TaxID=1411902 RepID=A0A291M444_9RHOB|nr:plasmid replication protein RepC [Pacificitalea manganoxidans]ATI43763.1 replication initiator RepC [Pacificitalea manganoxidans]MDR6310180.1 replication initiation protein RepC [Pacificitalea manganoxidans]